MICENRNCRYHLPFDGREPRVQVEEPDQTDPDLRVINIVERFRWITTGGREFFLCKECSVQQEKEKHQYV